MLLARVAVEHLEGPFARLVDELQPDRDLSRTPLFQVAFTMADTRAGLLDLAGIRAEPVPGGSPVPRFDLPLQIGPGAGGPLARAPQSAPAFVWFLLGVPDLPRVNSSSLRLQRFSRLFGLTAIKHL